MSSVKRIADRPRDTVLALFLVLRVHHTWGYRYASPSYPRSLSLSLSPFHPWSPGALNALKMSTLGTTSAVTGQTTLIGPYNHTAYDSRVNELIAPSGTGLARACGNALRRSVVTLGGKYGLSFLPREGRGLAIVPVGSVFLFRIGQKEYQRLQVWRSDLSKGPVPITLDRCCVVAVYSIAKDNVPGISSAASNQAYSEWHSLLRLVYRYDDARRMVVLVLLVVGI